MEELAKEILEEYARAYSQFDLEILAKTLEEIKQTTAKEIIDLANELILTIESEQAYTNFTLEVFKAGIRLMQTKIMERYGVCDGKMSN